MNTTELFRQVREGERPLVPIVVALALIWITFGIASPTFWTPENLVNLSLQSVSTGIIALGLVIVLLVGQIDLSVGSVSGLAAAVAAATSTRWGWPLALSVAVALAVGAAIGILYGLLIARFGLPGFVLTLGGLLIAAGAQWRILGSEGTINLPFDSWLVRFSQTAFVPVWLAWLLVGAVVLWVCVARVVNRSRRRAAGLPVEAPGFLALRVTALAALLGVPVAYLSQERGVGWSVVLFVALVAVADLLLRRTRWGRGIRAIGGDTHAAHLAGVAVRTIMISAFVVCSTLAALGGVLAAGRLAAANQSTGGGELFLMAIAAAIVGGTSLYGGRGSAWSALVGILVVQSIANGLTLLDLDVATRNIVTGTVLVLAVAVDTLLRRRRDQLALPQTAL